MITTSLINLQEVEIEVAEEAAVVVETDEAVEAMTVTIETGSQEVTATKKVDHPISQLKKVDMVAMRKNQASKQERTADPLVGYLLDVQRKSFKYSLQKYVQNGG